MFDVLQFSSASADPPVGTAAPPPPAEGADGKVRVFDRNVRRSSRAVFASRYLLIFRRDTVDPEP